MKGSNGPLGDTPRAETAGSTDTSSSGNGKARRRKDGMTGEAIVSQLKEDVCDAIDQVGLSFVRALEASAGRESGDVTIKCSYKPGGEKSNKRFIVRPSLNVTGQPIERPADTQGEQIVLFRE